MSELAVIGPDPDDVPSGEDLSSFEKKMPWEERAARIRDRFPSVDELDWEAALDRDMDLFGRIMRDILKLEQAVPGRPGPRPSLDVYAATRRMQQLFGYDFTITPFQEAFKVLAGDRSIRHVATKTGLNRNTVFRLLCGDQEPDGYEMDVIAKAFGKHPSYFLEWRILYITCALVRRLEWTPESSISMFRRLDSQRKTAES